MTFAAHTALSTASRPLAREGLRLAPLARKLSALRALSPQERAWLGTVDLSRERFTPGELIQSEQRPLERPYLILTGWAARQRVLPDGRRQILSFLLPGDTAGIRRGPAPIVPTAVAALTGVEIADASFLRSFAASADNENLADALSIAQAVEEAQMLDHLVRLGRQTALERTAHLLMELHGRLSAAGLSNGWEFPLPLTQEILADALGLSVVHTNRTLQQLRRQNLIESRNGHVTIREPEELARIGAYQRPRLARAPVNGEG